MDRLQYLMGLSSRDRLVAALIIAIIFLSCGWTVSEVNRTIDRNKCETGKQLLYKEVNTKELEIISLYNRLIDGQTKRADQLDSTISNVKNILKNEK